MNRMKILMNGIIKENPVLVLLLGTCPTLAVTTMAKNGLGMGLAATFVLIGSNVVISLLKKVIPDKVRIPAYIVVIAGFVTIIQLLVKALVPFLDKELGIFLPLIVVNCIILARAELFASKNTVLNSLLDGVGMGLGFTMALLIIGSIREIIGAGTWFGITLLPAGVEPMKIFASAPGGFFVFGCVIAAVNFISRKRGKTVKKSTGCAACPMAEQCGKTNEGGC
ncbi:electron transport complex subunit RsxE [Zongyangia hominis]|uniref:Ion-translocating oxidoreductase complex subunit E n=1 Tax=Zongyangia hominis TaxID=2763677 RepID=A0A926ECP5_9FIRM|nr:electron transport complex subunit E [Zongyangia hominis]MBC8569337.1 electron transport complex subunit E [Zongyangia hominis]